MTIETRLAELEGRLARTEARLRIAEDHLEITRLLTSYGPAVDSCASREAAQLWLADGVYDVGGRNRTKGHDAIAAMYDGPHHVGLTEQGSAHLTGTPRITVDGDKAEAVAYSFVVLHGGGVEDRFWIWRASANHWTLARTAQGWRIVERYNRVLNGSDDSHQTLRRGVAALA
ncbi:nuclear transport factor 2 family protein [Phenylobacterium sp.]|jgi:hypothetical protein|uniref:nuclear transport factor 2 family protein n=1 Tax=Phenylobacterium sp. TaxID=1871053 RepID=UPI002F41E22F